MKKVLTFFIVAIICILNVFPTIQSQNNYDAEELQTVVYSQQEKLEEHNYDGEDLIYNLPGRLGPLIEGTSNIPIYLKVKSPIENKNYFSHKGDYSLSVNSQLLHVLDSIIKKDSTLRNALSQFTIIYENNTLAVLKLISLLNNNIMEKEKTRELEAKAYLIFPIFSILCFISLTFFYYGGKGNFTKKARKQDRFVKQIIALLLVASIIGTGITIPKLISVMF